MIRFTFGKKEKLCSPKTFSLLLEKGKSVNNFPVRMVWMEMGKTENNNVAAQVAVTVSKRNFKKAVHRNRIKRLMREAYRLNKNLVVSYCEKMDISLAILFIYTGKTMPDYKDIEAKIILSLKRFQD